MKNILIPVCLLFLFCAAPLFAQMKADFGVIGGLNISDAKIEDDEGDDPKTESRNKFGTGILAEIALGDNVTFGANILYLRKGVKVGPVDDQESIFNVWADYIEIPLYFKYSYGTDIKPYVLVGPSLGILLSSEIDVEFGGINFTGDFKEVLKNSEFSIIFGAGLEAPVWIGRAFIQGRYMYGIQDVLKGGVVQLRAGETLQLQADIEAGDDLFTRNFLILAGFSVPL
jgi:hypothetical protein